MTATDELHRMLDERGVEWYEPTMKPNTTWFLDAYGINCRVKPWGDALCVKRYDLTPEQAVEATLGGDLQTENAKLREQMERLVTLLRVDCDIDASWDGLRRFWSIGLTEDGCLMRDRACKAEAENAKLRELVRHLRECTRHNVCAVCKYADDACDFDYDMRELGIEVDE